MSNYPADLTDNDPAFNLPSVGDGEDCCTNPDCESWRDGYDGEPCAECVAAVAADISHWLRVFTYDRPPTVEDDLDAYTEPSERSKREGLKRWVEKG